MAEAVVRRLSSLGLGRTEIKAKVPERPNVFCQLDGDPNGPTLMLSGHLDTKPVGDHSRWKTDPLGAEILDGQLYGLGCGDMKAAVAAMVYAAGALKATGALLGGNLLLAFFLLALNQARFEDAQGRLAVLCLRALVLARDDDVAGDMPDTYGGFVLLHVLTASR